MDEYIDIVTASGDPTGQSALKSEAYKNGWNEIFLNKVLKEEVDINGTGTHKYRIKHGPNKNKVV